MAPSPRSGGDGGGSAARGGERTIGGDDGAPVDPDLASSSARKGDAAAATAADAAPTDPTHPLIVVTGGDKGDASADVPPAGPAATSTPATAAHRRARWALYASHALSTTVGRGWEFGGALALLALAPNSLALPAALGLAEALAQAAGGAAIGRAVDALPRLGAATRFVLLQAACTLVSAGAVLAALHWRQGGPAAAAGLTPRVIGLGALAIVGAAGAALGAAGATVSVEKEWCAALAGGDGAALASLNAGMRRIDLMALVAAPAAVGGVLSGAGPTAGTAVIAIGAAVAVGPQLLLLAAAQRAAPDRLAGGGRKGDGQGDATPAPPKIRPGAALAAYAAAPAAPAGAALALLYCTVLSFGSTMTAYLQWRGLGAAELAGWRGGGAVAGLAATLAWPPARRVWGLDGVAGAGLAAQWACLAPALVTAVASPTVGAARGLAAGLALSRAGLWGFDLAASQALQERVPRSELGAVNGVQAGAQAGLGALAAAACLAVPQPARFGWLMMASLGVVTVASGVFWVGTGVVRRRRERAEGGGSGGGGLELGGSA